MVGATIEKVMSTCEAAAVPVTAIAVKDEVDCLSRESLEREAVELGLEVGNAMRTALERTIDWGRVLVALRSRIESENAALPKNERMDKPWERWLTSKGIDDRAAQRAVRLWNKREVIPEGVTTPTQALEAIKTPKPKKMSPAVTTVSAETRQEVEDLYKGSDTEVKWQKNGSAVSVERPGKTVVFPTPEAAIAEASKKQPNGEGLDQGLPEIFRPKPTPADQKPVIDDAIAPEDEAIAKLNHHVEIRGSIFNPFAGDGRIKRGFPDAIAAGIEGAKNFEPDMYLNCNELASWEAVKEVHGQPDWAIAQIDGSDPVQGLEFATLYAKVGIAVLVEIGFLANPVNRSWLRDKARHQELQIVAGDRLWLVWRRDLDWNHPGFTCPFIY